MCNLYFILVCIATAKRIHIYTHQEAVDLHVHILQEVT